MVWERINELKRKEEQDMRDKAAREERDRLSRQLEAKIKSDREEKQRQKERREKQERIDLVFWSSGVTKQMEELEKGLEGNVRKHALIKDLDNGVMKLVWGNKFKVTDGGEIDYEKPWIGAGVMDYSYIEARIGYKESISIQGGSVKNDGGSWDKEAVKDLLAKAYLHPARVNERDSRSNRGYSDSSSSGSTTEGCCG